MRAYYADQADAMPVQLRSGSSWSLVDDGARKGVLKLGYASTRPGSSLFIGPLPAPAGFSCVWLRATLGYLASSHDGQGTFNIGCTGCACTLAGASKAPWTRILELEFPLVNTNARQSRISALRLMSQTANISVTAITEFFVQLNTSAQCFLNITHLGDHLRGSQQRHKSSMQHHKRSRVRVDSLSLQPMEASALRQIRSPKLADHAQRTIAMKQGCTAPGSAPPASLRSARKQHPSTE